MRLQGLTLLFIFPVLPLWAQKAELVINLPHNSQIISAAISPGGEILASGSLDGSIKLWHIETEKLIRTIESQNIPVRKIQFDGNNNILALYGATGLGNTSCHVYDPNGKVIRNLRGNDFQDLSNDGEWVLDRIRGKYSLTNVLTGKVISSLKLNKIPIPYFEPEANERALISPGKKFFTVYGYDNILLVYETGNGRLAKKFESLFIPAYGFSQNDKLLALARSDSLIIYDTSGFNDKTYHPLDLESIFGPQGGSLRINFSADNKKIFISPRTVFYPYLHYLEFNLENGSYSEFYDRDPDIEHGREFIQDNVFLTIDPQKEIAYASHNKFLRKIELSTQSIKPFGPDDQFETFIPAFVDDTIFFLSESWSSLKLKSWDLSENSIRTEPNYYTHYSQLEELYARRQYTTTIDNPWIIVRKNNKSLSLDNPLIKIPEQYLVESEGGKTRFRPQVEERLQNQKDTLFRIKFSPNEQFLAISSSNQLDFYNLEKDSLIFSIDQSPAIRELIYGQSYYYLSFPEIHRVHFSNTKKWALIQEQSMYEEDSWFSIGSLSPYLSLWDLTTGQKLLSLITYGENDWLVVSPEGMFDGTEAAMNEALHFVVGNNFIGIDQLKERFYEPGLGHKILGYSNEPLRKSRGLNNIDIFPGIKLIHPDDNTGQLGIRLINQGGGIGQVQIYINGKEASFDARSRDFNPDSGVQQINYQIAGHPYVIPGEINLISVRAYNKEGYLVSDNKKLYYITDGDADPPEMHALIIGISDYRGDQLDLRFAAKDAVDFSNAIRIAGNQLFGIDNVNIDLLTTNTDDPGLWPDKENIYSYFEKITSKAGPSDVLIIYLSGHGTNYGGVDGDFYYLTAEAAGADLTDPVVRASSTISSAEFTEMIKMIPALKQVMIIDACHSGKLAENLMTRKSGRSAEEIRALERMKDRTGMFVLAGSAADAVSYEASAFGQGLLTYSVLLGMQGAALKYEEFVDVMDLFQFAADMVPEFAKNIGGIQKPEIRVPYGGLSFYIGQMGEPERKQINLPRIKPLFVRSAFSDQDTFDDHLGLSQLLDKRLLDSFDPRGSGRVIFVDASEFSEAFSLKGRYTKTGSDIKVWVRIFKDKNAMHDFEITGTDYNTIVDKIIEQTIHKVSN